MFAVIEMKSEFGARIKKYRKLAGMSQIELAQRLNVTNRAVSNWESGANCADSELIPLICEVLGVSPNELLNTKTEEPQLPPETIALARRIEALDPVGREFIETAVAFAESKMVHEERASDLQIPLKKIGIIRGQGIPMYELTHDSVFHAKMNARQELREMQEQEQKAMQPETE